MKTDRQKERQGQEQPADGRHVGEQTKERSETDGHFGQGDQNADRGGEMHEMPNQSRERADRAEAMSWAWIPEGSEVWKKAGLASFCKPAKQKVIPRKARRGRSAHPEREKGWGGGAEDRGDLHLRSTTKSCSTGGPGWSEKLPTAGITHYAIVAERPKRAVNGTRQARNPWLVPAATAYGEGSSTPRSPAWRPLITRRYAPGASAGGVSVHPADAPGSAGPVHAEDPEAGFIGSPLVISRQGTSAGRR